MSARGIPWEPLLAVAAALLLAGVVVWYVGHEMQPPKAVIPGYSGPPFTALSARVPEIAGWSAFYVNDDNPFVPWREREVEAQRLKAPKPIAIKPLPPAVIKPVEVPKKNLPPRAAGGGDVPRVLGFQARFGGPNGVSAALVQMPGESQVRLMRTGETVGRWTLIAIEAGNIASFKDADGRVQAVVIGGGR